MAWFRKKTDPISDRARELNEEIADLEQKIKKLDSRLQSESEQSQPRLRSTVLLTEKRSLTRRTYRSPSSPRR